MKEKLILWAVEMFVAKLSSEDLKRWIEMGLDILENKVKDTENTVDDMLVTAFAEMVRGSMDMHDEDFEATA